MEGLCEGANEPPDWLKAIIKKVVCYFEFERQDGKTTSPVYQFYRAKDYLRTGVRPPALNVAIFAVDKIGVQGFFRSSLVSLNITYFIASTLLGPLYSSLQSIIFMSQKYGFGGKCTSFGDAACYQLLFPCSKLRTMLRCEAETLNELYLLPLT